MHTLAHLGLTTQPVTAHALVVCALAVRRDPHQTLPV